MVLIYIYGCTFIDPLYKLMSKFMSKFMSKLIIDNKYLNIT